MTQFVHFSSKTNFEATKRILHYVHSTKHFRISYFKRANVAPYSIVTDSDHAGDLHCNSVHGSYHFCYGNLVVWTSGRSKTSTPLHSTEAEYVGLSQACTLGMQYYNLLKESTDVIKAGWSIPVHVDNTACKAYAENVILARRVKHVDVRFHVVRTWCNQGIFKLHWISTIYNVADMLTKALPITKKGSPCLLFLHHYHWTLA